MLCQVILNIRPSFFDDFIQEITAAKLALRSTVIIFVIELITHNNNNNNNVYILVRVMAINSINELSLVRCLVY